MAFPRPLAPPVTNATPGAFGPDLLDSLRSPLTGTELEAITSQDSYSVLIV